MGKSFGDWQITSSLGEGGQGYTYIVTRPPDAELFALKRLKNKNRVGRFRNEIEAGLALSHPNVLRIVDHCLQDGAEPWVVSEYCSSGTLSQIDRGPWMRSYTSFSRFVLA